MSALTSLLVRDRVVPVSKIEEALQTQVFSGGDIEVILLELNALPEDVLSAYRAALFDLLPATRDEVMRASREALRRVPAELARALAIVPIYYERRSLVVAAWEPMYEPQLRELEAQLDCEISVRIVNQARLAAGLSQHYGFDLDVRMRRLSDALRKREPGVVPYVRPPSPSLVPVPPLLDSPLAGARMNEPGADDSGPSVPGIIDVEIEVDDEPAKPSELPTEPAARALEPERPPQTASERGAGAGEPELAPALAAAPTPSEGPEPEEEPSLPLGVSPTLAKLLRDAISLERATELLRSPGQRDDVLFVLLRYVQQFFDFACIFSVSKEGARARMAHGAGISRETLSSALVPPAERGLFADAVRSGKPCLGELGTAPEERAAQAFLHREPGRLGLAIPLELNGRVVLLVYVERVRAGLGLEHASPVQAILPAVLAALRRLILESKAQRRASSLPPAQPAGSTPPAQVTTRSASEAKSPSEAPTLPPAAARDAEPAAGPLPPERAVQDAEPTAPAMAAPPMAEAPMAEALDDGESQPVASGELEAAEAESREERAYDAEVVSNSELSAIDLDAFERLAAELAAEASARPIPRLASEQRANSPVRERIAGVPRSAPPPPAHETVAPAFASGSYRQRGSTGAAKERTHVPESASAALAVPGALAEGEAGEARARQRLSLVEAEVEVPSVIIDMGDSIETLVESLQAAAPGSEPPEIDDLLQLGETALPVLMQRFPGPLWFDRTRPYRRRPRGRDVSAIARALSAFGERAAPYLASLIGNSDPDIAFYALLVASEIVHPDLIDPVARRVLDPDEALRGLALEVLRGHALLPQYEIVLRALSDLSERPGREPGRQRLAVEALGELRDSRALGVLLARLVDSDEQVARAAHRALVLLTGQDFGGNLRRWGAWAEGWRRAHRVEWLIEALLHSEEQIRTIAGEELKLLTQQYFGYHPALPKRDREVAQRKYREWWELEGRLAFAR